MTPTGPSITYKALQFPLPPAERELLQRLALLPVTVVCAAVAGYREELRHMRDAAPNWCG